MHLDIPYPKIDLDDAQLERLFTIIPALIVILGALGVLWFYFSVMALLPDSESVVNIPELSTKASVTRDLNGVPTIIAASEEDAAVVLGYVMAQDRLWQMDYLRRAGDGRLAEILGKGLLPRDQFMRTIRRSPGLVNELSRLDERESIWLDRFVQGINRFIENRKGKYPVEFSFFDYKPQSFSRKDVNSIICAVAWDSSVSGRLDPLLNRIAGRFGASVINDLLPLNPLAPRPTLPYELTGWEPKGVLFSQMDLLHRQGFTNGFKGGCGWGVSPDRHTAGTAVIGSVVYQNLSAPSFWYRARISAGDFRLTGAFIPGVPVALSGSNQHMCWSSVHIPVDDADLYIELMDCNSECRYYRADGWRKCEKLEENFTFESGASQTTASLRTDTGPIVSDIEKGRAIALRWTGLAGMGLFPAMYHINRSTNVSELRMAASVHVAPVFQIIWADSSGNIGSQIAGKIPIRPASSDGVIAVPAWTGVHGWHGFVPFQELPAVTNPPEGVILAGEGTFENLSRPFLSTIFQDIASRHNRLYELLGKATELDREYLIRIPLDAYSTWAAKLVPSVVQELEQDSSYSPLEAKALSALKSWDFVMDKDSAGAAVFSLWYDSFVSGLLRDKVGDALYHELAGHPELMALMAQNKLTNSGLSGSPDHDLKELMRKSFHVATSTGKKLLGDDFLKWTWGGLHRIEFQHPLAARSGFIGVLFDVGPFSLGGSWDTIKLSGWFPTNSFRQTSGCSLIQLTEMAPKPVLLSSVPLGNSSHFFSSHYKNQIAAWQRGRLSLYAVMPQEDLINGHNVVVFEPVRLSSPTD